MKKFLCYTHTHTYIVNRTYSVKYPIMVPSHLHNFSIARFIMIASLGVRTQTPASAQSHIHNHTKPSTKEHRETRNKNVIGKLFHSYNVWLIYFESVRNWNGAGRSLVLSFSPFPAFSCFFLLAFLFLSLSPLVTLSTFSLWRST